MATSSARAAPWRSLFLEHISTMDSPEFTLATLHPNAPSSHPGGPAASPRARTCVFRGMFASLPVNPKNDAPLNPPAYESDLLTFTTDARMHKMPDLFGTSTATSASLGSGGGSEVEAVFWPRETGTQWRLRGTAWILNADLDSKDASREGESAAEADTGAARVRTHLLSQLRARSKEETNRAPVPKERQDKVVSDDEGWTFAREITAQFGNLSPGMRGTFKNPPPGTPKKAEDGDDALGQKVETLDDAEARANFRVVVVVPAEVDQTDLSDPQKPRRWIYRKVDEGETSNKWEKVEVWP